MVFWYNEIMTYYDQFKKNIVLPQAILTHILDIFPTLVSFNVWLYFYGNESLAPSQIASFLKMTTADVNQAINLFYQKNGFGPIVGDREPLTVGVYTGCLIVPMPNIGVRHKYLNIMIFIIF